MRLKELKAELIQKASALPSPALEASIIIEEAASVDRIHQITDAESEIPDAAAERCIALMDKRISGIPMAYITGKKEFYGMEFRVTPDTLIPRPDTETIVSKAIEIAECYGCRRILDLCTGSGAIAASVAVSLGTDVSFSDISEPALAVAAENYERLTGRRGDGRLGSLFEPWAGERFDMIITNPPYLTEKWWDETDKDVKAEPVIALISDSADGLDIIRRIIKESTEHLNDGGFLLIEGDYRQMDICVRILTSAGFTDTGIVSDLAGKARVAYGRREH